MSQPMAPRRDRDDARAFVDLEIVCCDCACSFFFERGEQLFFRSRELAPPKRCPSCRSAKRARDSGDY